MLAALPPYMTFPDQAREISVSQTVYLLLSAAGNPSSWKEVPRLLCRFKPSLEGHTPLERLQKWKKLVDSEFLNLHQLFENIKDPIGQWAHTAHAMYRLPSGMWVVDHYYLQQKVTVDFVREASNGSYLGKAGNRWDFYEREHRVVLNGNPSGNQTLENLLEAYTVKVFP